jgi:hypothetical protein
LDILVVQTKFKLFYLKMWIALSGVYGHYINYNELVFQLLHPINSIMQIFKHLDKEIDIPQYQSTMQIQLMPILTSAQIITQGPFWHVP